MYSLWQKEGEAVICAIWTDELFVAKQTNQENANEEEDEEETN